MNKEKERLIVRLKEGRLGGEAELKELTKESLIDLVCALDVKIANFWCEEYSKHYKDFIKSTGSLLADFWG